MECIGYRYKLQPLFRPIGSQWMVCSLSCWLSLLPRKCPGNHCRMGHPRRPVQWKKHSHRRWNLNMRLPNPQSLVVTTDYSLRSAVAWEYWICNFKVFKNHHHQVSSSNWSLKACLVSSLYTSKGFFLSVSWRYLPTSNCVFLFHTSLSLFCPTHPFWWHKIWRCIFNHTSQGDTWWWWWYYSSSFFLDWAKIPHTSQNFNAVW